MSHSEDQRGEKCTDNKVPWNQERVSNYAGTQLQIWHQSFLLYYEQHVDLTLELFSAVSTTIDDQLDAMELWAWLVALLRETSTTEILRSCLYLRLLRRTSCTGYKALFASSGPCPVVSLLTTLPNVILYYDVQQLQNASKVFWWTLICYHSGCSMLTQLTLRFVAWAHFI